MHQIFHRPSMSVLLLFGTKTDQTDRFFYPMQGPIYVEHC